MTTVVSSASGGVPPHGMVGIAMDVGSSHIISSGSTYLIHGGNMEGSRNHISHSSRSSSAMVSVFISPWNGKHERSHRARQQEPTESIVTGV